LKNLENIIYFTGNHTTKNATKTYKASNSYSYADDYNHKLDDNVANLITSNDEGKKEQRSSIRIADYIVGKETSDNACSSNDWLADYALTPPPYRCPPSPRSKIFSEDEVTDLSQSLFHLKYVELIGIIHDQTDELNKQEIQIQKMNEEIRELEGKSFQKNQILQAIMHEVNQLEIMRISGIEKLKAYENAQQEEHALKREVSSIRDKLSHCQIEIVRCQNEAKLLINKIYFEEQYRSGDLSNYNNEIDRLQEEMEKVVKFCDQSKNISEALAKETKIIESLVHQKKQYLEQLINEIKAENLQSLARLSLDENKYLLDNSQRTTSSRRIIGSPRKLENAAPTSKNPHGVWV